MDIPGALSGVSTALTIVKQLNDIDKQVDEAGFKLRIAEATASLAEAKLGLIDAQEELRSKDREINDLKERLKYRFDNLVEHKGYRYSSADGNPIGNPLCPICEETGSHIKLVRMITVSGQPLMCPKCKSNHSNVATFGYPSD